LSSSREIVLGTYNEKKRSELQALLAPLGFNLSTLRQYPNAIEVVEDGNTFAENAEKKAVQQAVHLDRWVIAEDSGLSVDALDGAPGIYSARFSGDGATDESNNRLMLEKLSGVPLEKRTAFYTCHIVLSDPKGNILSRTEATCRGIIGETPRGEHGFGYDPLFIIPEYHLTFGQLGTSVKSMFSHRAKATRRFVATVKQLLRTQPELLRSVSSG